MSAFKAALGYATPGINHRPPPPQPDAPGTIPDKLPPHNAEAEEALLCSIINDGSNLAKIAHIGLTGADFYIHRNGWVFDAGLVLQSDGQKVNVITLEDALKQAGRFDDLGPARLLDLMSLPTSIYQAESYARTIFDKSLLRQRIDQAGQIARIAYGTNGSDSVRLGAIETIIQSSFLPKGNQGANGCFSNWAELSDILGPIRWDWPGWLARGFFHIVAGASGEGKSNLILRLVECYLIGTAWPDGKQFEGELGEVLWCETESAQALNFERANNWMLPIEKIRSPLANPLDNVNLDDPGHQAAIFAAARNPAIKLIVVDSLSGGTRKDSKASSEMLKVGGFLAELARDTGKPVLVTHHLRKKGITDGEQITLDRLRDSSALTQLSRVVWAIDRPDSESPEKKRLAVIKSNLMRLPNPIGFEINGLGLDFFEAPAPPRKETQLDRAIELLKTQLAHEPKPFTWLKEQAESAAISTSTLRRAQEALKINPTKKGGIWLWSLPINS